MKFAVIYYLKVNQSRKTPNIPNGPKTNINIAIFAKTLIAEDYKDITAGKTCQLTNHKSWVWAGSWNR